MGGGVKFSGKKHYEGVRFNVIRVMRGWVGVQFPGKKRHVTLEWPERCEIINEVYVVPNSSGVDLGGIPLSRAPQIFRRNTRFAGTVIRPDYQLLPRFGDPILGLASLD